MIDMQPTAAAAAAAVGAPRASPRLSLKVARQHTAAGGATADTEAVSANSAQHGHKASSHAHNSAAAMVVDAAASAHAAASPAAAASAAAVAAHNMPAPSLAQLPILRSVSEMTPGSGSGRGLGHAHGHAQHAASSMHSPPLSARPSTQQQSTGVSPHCAGLQVSTPLTKRAGAHSLSSTPSPMSLPPPTMAASTSGARRKLMGSGSNGGAAAAAAATCHGLPPSPQARAIPANHLDQATTLTSAASSEQAPPRKKTPNARAGAGTKAAAGSASSLSFTAPSSTLTSTRASSPHFVRSQSCTEMSDSGRHELRLPSRRELSVDYITPRVAAMVLLGQQQKNLANANAAGDGSGATSPPSPSALSALGALTPDETRQMHDWSLHFDRVHVLDARFEYEYDGGHILGAVNVTSLTQVEDLLGLWAPLDQSSPAEEAINQYQNAVMSTPSAAAAAAALQHPSTPSSGVPTPAPILFGPRVCVLIHCEFSKKRGPKCFTFLRNRDRKLNLSRWPHLHYPEMYCIAGGYQAFFNQQPASPTAAAAAAGAGSALEVGGTTVAQSLCHPPAYVSMTHPAFKKELAVAWSRMKKSSHNAPMAASPSSMYAQAAYSPKSSVGGVATAAGRASPAAAAAEVIATPKSTSGGPPQRRTKGQTRSFSEISADMVNTPSPVNLGRSLPLSAANLASPPASLAARTSSMLTGGAGAAAAVAVATGAAGLMGAPRSVRGLGVVLDGSATTGAAGSAGPNGASSVGSRSAFSFKRQTSFGASSAFLHALTQSSPPFVATPSPVTSAASSGSSAAAAGSTGLFVPASPGPGPTPSPLSILPPASSSFFGAPCASPLLHYGWSMEERSSTPSPFPESPRITSSTAPSPLSWSQSGSSAQQQAAALAYGRGTPTPLSMLSEDSPRAGGATLNHSLGQGRSRSSSTANALSNPPVFVGAGSAAASAAQAPAPAPAPQRANWGGFASPSSRVSRRSSVSTSTSSPSSALHSMHLRSSPSPSYSGGGSSSNGSSSNTQPLSSRSSSSPSPALFYESASSSVHATPRGPSLSNDPLQPQQLESPGELASAISGGGDKLLLLDSELPITVSAVLECSSPSKKARYARETTVAACAAAVPTAPTTRGQARSMAFSSGAVPTATGSVPSACDESSSDLPQCTQDTQDMADD